MSDQWTQDEWTLSEIEREIGRHQRAIAILREEGIRLDEAANMSGQEARQWLTKLGATDAETAELVADVIRERRAGREATQ